MAPDEIRIVRQQGDGRVLFGSGDLLLDGLVSGFTACGHRVEPDAFAQQLLPFPHLMRCCEECGTHTTEVLFQASLG